MNISVFVLPNLWVRSPRKLLFFVVQTNVDRMKVSRQCLPGLNTKSLLNKDTLDMCTISSRVHVISGFGLVEIMVRSPRKQFI